MITALKILSKSHFNIKKAITNKKAYDQIVKDNLFDEEFYMRNYIIDDEETPLIHYMFDGYKKGYDPSTRFSTNKYLNKYKNVKEAEMNPLVHYVNYGKSEEKETFKSELKDKEDILNLNKKQLKNYKIDEKPLVSIIVLNKDKVDYLKVLFKDFSKRTNYSNFEFILVDNASSDDSVKYVKSLDLDFPLHIIENKENLTFSKSNNEACKIANGEYLLFLNNDIETTYGWLNEMMGVMLNNENVGSVGAKLLFPYSINEEKSLKIQHASDVFDFRKDDYYIYAYNFGKFKDPFDEECNAFKKVASVTGATLLVKKSVFEKIGGFDEGYIYGYEDVDFSFKLLENGYDIYYCPSALLFHKEMGTRKAGAHYKNNNENLYRKWENYLNREIYLDKINNSKFLCEHPLKLLFIVDDIYNLPKPCLKLMELCNSESYPFYISNNSKLEVDGNIDIVLSFVEDLNICGKLRKNLIKISCMDEKEIENPEFYDLVMNDNFDDFKNILTEYVLEKYN